MQGAGGEEGAGGVAEGEDVVVDVDLGLKEPDAGGEGQGRVVELVACDGEGGGGVAEEGGVMGAHVG